MPRLLITISAFLTLTVPLSAATYHVDGAAGADDNSGLTPGQAWKSLDRVNRQVFMPGDQIRFKAGTHYIGQFKPQGSGRVIDGKPAPIVVGKYGEGRRPRIDGEGKVLDTVLLRNVEYWEIQDLEVTNQGPAAHALANRRAARGRRLRHAAPSLPS